MTATTAIQAQYSGICPECEEAIRVGDMIQENLETWQWEHSECPNTKPRPVCMECFMETALNGSCGCEK